MSLDPNDVLKIMRDFCQKYFKTKPSSAQKLEMTQKLDKFIPQICGQLCERLNREILDKEPNVLLLKGQCCVFGDLHGNLEDVFDYENKFWMNKNPEKDMTYVFLGDFVDRGLFSTEVSIYLLALKLSNINKFALVRGNHEVRIVNKGYTFFTECIKKYGQTAGPTVWDQINTCFERLPFAAVIDNLVFCCHGGVPKSLQSLEDLQKVVKPLVDPAVEAPATHEILWNDPIESMATYTLMTERVLRQKRVEFIPNKVRSTAYYFTSLAVRRFLEINGFSHIIRAHECVDEGFRYTSEDRVLTVFSSSNYCGKANTTACIKVSINQIQVILLKTPQPSPSSSIQSTSSSTA